MYFHDVNAKINKTINERSRIYFSLYSGGDHTVFSRLVRGYGVDWGNATATLRWNHVLNEKTYGNWGDIFLPEPRAELSYYPDQNNRISISFNQTSQTLHMLSNSFVGLPSDIWVPANVLLKPAVMRQVAVGYERNIMDRHYAFSVEAYYRKTNHIIDYKDNANVFLNNRIENEIETGSSKAYGIEFNRGKFTGWLSYTLSRSRNRLDNIKDTEYHPVYDRPHKLKLFLNYNIGKRLSLSPTFSFCSGMNVTLPTAKYASQVAVLFIYTERNGYRAPAFHQLDISGTYRFNKGRSLALSVINVYSRKDVFSIYAGRERGYYLWH